MQLRSGSNCDTTTRNPTKNTYPPLLGVVISASSLERWFVKRTIEESLVFSHNVVVVYGDHLFTGEPEDIAFFDALKKRFSREVASGSLTFLKIEVPPDVMKRPAVRSRALDIASVVSPAGCRPRTGVIETSASVQYHNAARKSGFKEFVDNGVTRSREAGGTRRTSIVEADLWVLFLDADEVPEGRTVCKWWNASWGLGSQSHQTMDRRVTYKMANWWYFLLPDVRSDTPQDSVLLVHSSNVTDAGLCDPQERDGILAHACLASSSRSSQQAQVQTVCSRMTMAVVSNDRSVIMFHHYSWVRSREDLLRKVQAWGHRGDAPWQELLEHAWRLVDERGEVPSREFVHGTKLERVSGSDMSFGDDAAASSGNLQHHQDSKKNRKKL